MRILCDAPKPACEEIRNLIASIKSGDGKSCTTTSLACSRYHSGKAGSLMWIAKIVFAVFLALGAVSASMAYSPKNFQESTGAFAGNCLMLALIVVILRSAWRDFGGRSETRQVSETAPSTQPARKPLDDDDWNKLPPALK
jgi:hypothetical protein